MVYRESFESCPRCETALDDSGALRGCSECRGQWVLETQLAEMVLEMLPPGVFGRLVLIPVTSVGTPTPCPSCSRKMEAVSMFGVSVERCPKQHGVWFDPEELQIALRRAADPARHIDAAATLAPQNDPALFSFAIAQPGDPVRIVRTRDEVIKIGRLDICQVQLSDSRVMRVHAAVEVTAEGPVVHDLGAETGTLVNGTPVDRRLLTSGDRITVGASTITVTFAPKTGGSPQRG